MCERGQDKERGTNEEANNIKKTTTLNGQSDNHDFPEGEFSLNLFKN